ncbi:putative PEP-binding protein [Photobacterium sp. MCCC 1A19761]|uniref:putative PEP-binding protein n=1 Tax=Photobacterium sp. MCCC 1A19761 TaxID=3115000 RepID=UPI00307DC64A
MDDLIHRLIGIHPYAIAETMRLPEATQQAVLARAGDATPEEWFVHTLAQFLEQAAAHNGDHPLRVRLSGADSHSRRSLLGSELEAPEVHPLIGLRGASRFADPAHRPSFDLECEAVKLARQTAGGRRIELVLPFVRTYCEAATMIDLLAEQGLYRGVQGLNVHLMCELPTNALLAEKFLPYFDGMLIDVDQLGQFALGLDQAHPALNDLHDDQNEAILKLLHHAIQAAVAAGKPCEVVSRAIEQSPKLQQWLIEQGINGVISY